MAAIAGCRCENDTIGGAATELESMPGKMSTNDFAPSNALIVAL